MRVLQHHSPGARRRAWGAMSPLTPPPVCRPGHARPPAVAQLQLTQFPGAAACAGRTWVADCATWATAEVTNGEIRITPAASKASAAAPAVATAPLAAFAPATPAVNAGGDGTMGVPAPVPVAAARDDGAPGPSGAVSASRVLGLGTQPAAAAPVFAAGAAPVTIQESGSYSPGRRLRQAAAAPSVAGPAGAAAPVAPAAAPLLPPTVNYVPPPLTAAAAAARGAAAQCAAQQAVRGAVTSPALVELIVPGWKDLVPAVPYGNDTLVVQFPGQGCFAAYKVVQGSLLGLQPPAPVAAKSAAAPRGVAAGAWAATAAAAAAAALALAF
jgi:hypothetical protein